MSFASTFWGRAPAIAHIATIAKPGSVVLDLGCGSGWTTRAIAEIVGEKGRVIGVDSDETAVDQAIRDHGAENIQFLKMDAMNDEPEILADVVTSLLVLPYLTTNGVRGMFRTASRSLKRSGTVVMLTTHPSALELPFDLSFLVCHPDDLKQYRRAREKEGVGINITAYNTMNESTKAMLINHTWETIHHASVEAGLTTLEAIDLWIDPEQARQFFGPESVRIPPTTPTFLLFILQ